MKKIGKYGPYVGGKEQSIETVPEEAQLLELVFVNFKSAMVNMFEELKEIM